MAAEPLPMPVRRLPKVVETVRLPEPYSQFSIRAWTNFPESVIRQLGSGVTADAVEAFYSLVVGHDLCDFDGQDYPPADQRDTFHREPILDSDGKQMKDAKGKPLFIEVSNNDGFLSLLPNGLARVITQAIFTHVGRLPSPTAPRSLRS